MSMVRIKKITPIPPEPSVCIEVDSPTRLFEAGGDNGVVTHNSVVQRNIIFGTIMRPESWNFIGIDLKKVELSAFRAYSNVVLGVATTLDDALEALRFGQQVMMQRYAVMEKSGYNNFIDMPGDERALMIMVDELGELTSPSGVKALSEHTPIPLAEGGSKPLGKIEPRDIILDNYSSPASVVKKYEPESQERYDLTIRKERTGESEVVVSGSEHNWAAYFTFPDGRTEGPEIVDTKFLYDFKKEQDARPENERVKVRFKKMVNKSNRKDD